MGKKIRNQSRKLFSSFFFSSIGVGSDACGNNSPRFSSNLVIEVLAEKLNEVNKEEGKK